MSTTPRKGFTGRIERGPMVADVLRRDFATIYNRARGRNLSTGDPGSAWWMTTYFETGVMDELTMTGAGVAR